MKYYVFEEGTRYFYKTSTLQEATAGNTPKRVFRHVEGIPNPWFVQEYQGRRGQWGLISYLDFQRGQISLQVKERRR